MQSGLWSSQGPVPLVDVQVKGRVVDFIAEVIVTHKYMHHEANALEATFKFPLDLFGALCGFEVVLDGNRIVAEVRKREEALHISSPDADDESNSTRNRNKLDESQTDLFLCNIGNLAPGKEVELKLTYVTELVLEGHSLRFVLPSSTISPNYIPQEVRSTGENVSLSNNQEKKTTHGLQIDLDIVMPHQIVKIESPTHQINVTEQKDSHAIVQYQVAKDSQSHSHKDGNFVLLVKYDHPHDPWSLVEYDETTSTNAVMLSFFPKFNSKTLSGCEVIFLVDCSMSMGGTQMENVKSALQLFIRSLPNNNTYFNIIEFGSTFQKLFPTSVLYNNESLETATKRIQEMDAELGGTELYAPLSEIYANPPINNLPRQLFIITDGQVPNTRDVISLVGRNSHNTRVFTLGIGDRVSYGLVSGMAREGCGESEFVIDSSVDSLEDKVMRHLKRALQPALTQVHLDWSSFISSSSGEDQLVQAPQKLRTLFNGDRLLVYAFLAPTAKQGTVTLKANGGLEGPVSFSVSIDTNSNVVRQGRLIHVLAARTRIRDLEEGEVSGIEDAKREIIRLGTTYSLASCYTSFVGVYVGPNNSNNNNTAAAATNNSGSNNTTSDNGTVETDNSDTTKPNSPQGETNTKKKLLNLHSSIEIPKSNPTLASSTTAASSSSPNSSAESSEANINSSSPSTPPKLSVQIPNNNNTTNNTPVTPITPSSATSSTSSTPSTSSSNNTTPTRSFVSNMNPGTPSFVPPSLVGFSSTPATPTTPSTPSGKPKKVYDPDFLMKFRTVCTELPEGINPPMDIILGNTSQNRDNRLNQNGVHPNNRNEPRSPKVGGGGRGGAAGGRGGKGHRRQTSTGKSPALNNSKSKNSTANLPPVAPLQASEGRWVRPQVASDEDNEAKFRKSQGILNKLTIEKFESLSTNLLNVGITNIEVLRGIIKQVYDKAVLEPHFATLYAVLCAKLSEQCPTFEDSDGKPQSFKRILLNKCQEEFENKSTHALDPSLDPAEREAIEWKYKKRTLGNIKFIGELYKERMLPEKIMHECIGSLLRSAEENSNNSNASPASQEEDIESLCKLITTIGKDLDHPKAKLRTRMDEYFQILERMTKNNSLPSRIRFMIKDVMDLRANDWIPRRKENEAKTLAAARAEAMESSNDIGPSTPTLSNPKGLRKSESRETVAMSPGMGRGRGGIPRSQSMESMEEWETARGSGRGNKSKGAPPSPTSSQQSQQGWEVVGGSSGGGRGKGRGRGYVERYAPKNPMARSSDDVRNSPALGRSVSVDSAAANKPTVVKGNLFSALLSSSADDPSQLAAPSPRSALKGSKQSASAAPSSASSSGSRGVTIQEPSKQAEPLSKDDLNRKAEMLLEEYLTSADVDEARECLQELKDTAYYPDFINRAVCITFEKKERDRNEITRLLAHLKEKSVLTVDDLKAGFSSVLASVDDIDIDIPFASKYLAFFIGHSMTWDDSLQPSSFTEEGVVDESLINSGKASQILMTTLQTVHQIRGENGLIELLQEDSKFDIKKLMKPSERNNEAVKSLLQQKNLSFLIPTLLGESVENNNNNNDTTTTTTTTTTNSTSSSSTFNQLVMYQTADGNFKFSPGFAKEVLDIPFATLNSSVPKSIINVMDNIDEDEEETSNTSAQDILSMWSTVLALEYLEKNHDQVRDRWELMANKAEEWLKKILSKDGKGYGDIRVEDLRKEAQQLLASKSKKN